MQSLARRPVLYVEDHPVNALLMAAIFERRPQLELVIATHGEEAMHKAAGLKPSLLLLDLSLPDCHGSELLGRLRAVAGCERAPAIAVTAHADFDITGTGFCELWPKPLNLGHVLRRLDSLTGVAPAQPPAPEPSAPMSRMWALAR
ncbi:CheY-like chemotaxis protein [Pelomonas aquatica]|uniref:CheY-like chemotaxis protein n=1 Tax=Pelomonas aquatica TaxID=431058 RepID=A0ABU1ZB05_9BURK|nr:response regulator [Pelomonas aquatica]MDR7297813.1 CheY-like chemotaxis protein [Pelomonas aquatica]